MEQNSRMPPQDSAAGVRLGDEPPELPRDAVSVYHGSTFALSDRTGDVSPDTVTGVFCADTRHLSRFELTIDGMRLTPLSGGQIEPHEARFFLTNATGSLAARTISIERRRMIGEGLRESIIVRNHDNVPVRMQLTIRYAADFADLFEVKDAAPRTPGSTDRTEDRFTHSVVFSYEREPFRASTDIRFSREPEFRDGAAVFPLELPARGSTDLVVDVTWTRRDDREAPVRVRPRPRASSRERDLGATDWRGELPQLRSDSDPLERTWIQSCTDLAALGMQVERHDQTVEVPAAGLPWFMAVFGRDTLITSYQSLYVAPDLCRGTLEILAALQGDEDDPFRDEEPGKIMHELRHGELTVCGDTPHRPYYGSVDATPLFLIVLSEYHRVTRDDELVRALWPNVRRAIAWIEEARRRDADGLLAYETRSSRGLENQGWKDSGAGIRFGDGRIARPPLALCEVQGYVYDAYDRVAALAEDAMDDAELAATLRKERDVLRDRFDELFWTDDRGGYYALAIDGDGAQVDSLTSNIGHLLWSGIVPDERADTLVERLFSGDLWSGWGIRTTAWSDAGYSPLGYHTGTVWAHDNSVISAGLARYGFREEANRIAVSMLDAAGYRGYRLPEAFAGYDRADTDFPVRYPTASDPQAWATAAPFLWMTLMLGLRVDADGSLGADPVVPASLQPLRLAGIRAGGRRWNVEVADQVSVTEQA
jgi:glycogen debranching enzyme